MLPGHIVLFAVVYGPFDLVLHSLLFLYIFTESILKFHYCFLGWVNNIGLLFGLDVVSYWTVIHLWSFYLTQEMWISLLLSGVSSCKYLYHHHHHNYHYPYWFIFHLVPASEVAQFTSPLSLIPPSCTLHYIIILMSTGGSEHSLVSHLLCGYLSQSLCSQI